MVPGSQRYFHAWPVLNHFHFLAADNLLYLSRDTDCVLANYSAGGGSGTLVIIQYAGPEECLRGWHFFQSAFLPEHIASPNAFCHPLEGGEWTAGRRNGARVALALGATSEGLAAQLVEAVEWRADE